MHYIPDQYGPNLTAALRVSADRLARHRRAASRPDPAVALARSYAGRPSAFIRELRGPSWDGPDWLAWRSFVKTVFAEPQTEEELEVFRKCTGLEQPPDRRQREVWLPVGRRGGKSLAEAMVALYMACCFDYTPYLAPGERAFVLVLADSKAHAGQIMSYIKGHLREHRVFRSFLERDLVETIDLLGRVTIQVVAASLKAVRSRTVVASIFDEVAFWKPDEDCADPDVEIVRGIRPSMLTIPNSLQMGASSRYARKGVLWNAYRDWYGKPEGPLVWSADTITMHPSVDQEEIAAEYQKDPVAAGAEYGLEWRADVAAFVDPAVVEAAVMRGQRELPPRPGVTYRAFVDPSGGSGEDSFTMAIAHGEGDRGVLDVIREIRPPFSPKSAVAELAGTLRDYRVQVVRGDHYAGDWPTAEFREHSVAYEISDMTKSEIYVNWLPLMNSGRVSLLDEPRLILQTCGLERRTSRAGRDSIDHAPRAHDDVVNAAAGALLQVASTAQVIQISDQAMARALGRRWG